MKDQALTLAILFHHTYERLAPQHGYDTRVETRVFDSTTPNGKLMIAVCDSLIQSGAIELLPSPEQPNG